jgi:hypothetical protein
VESFGLETKSASETYKEQNVTTFQKTYVKINAMINYSEVEEIVCGLRGIGKDPQ